ncbi:Sirtuin 6 [Cyanidiococcus yangmingshanensis]|uniref:protein acetyllysine N-acetyltransferase n=1 Tax=Cyanidiococcus yangmingshanensis TaxID=2690220 RepID=A0A7J7IJV8_9RHOD|nr:Sirtuin 6 [Cyanidiococcus yangmingshanensis]
MALDYAKRLRPYENKGRLALEPEWDRLSDIRRKVQQLAQWFQAARGQIVVHTGAGLSTAAGVRDFRGRNGVWSVATDSAGDQPKSSSVDTSAFWELQQVGGHRGGDPTDLDDPREQPLPPESRLELAAPTLSHWALTKLVQCGYVRRIVTQNIDGLHLRSGLGRHRLSELHGNIFAEQCARCGRVFLNDVAVPTVGCRRTGHECVHCGRAGYQGALRDMLLDWEDPLPAADLKVATEDSREARLCLVIGSSMQMLPAATIACLCLRNPESRLVIVNASWTARDRLAHLVIRAPADMVLVLLLDELALLRHEAEQVNIWRQQLALGVRLGRPQLNGRPTVDLCVWNGHGDAPGVHVQTEENHASNKGTEQEHLTAEEQELWLSKCRRFVPRAEQVAAWEALALDRQGCLRLVLACFGNRPATERSFCAARPVRARLHFSAADGGSPHMPTLPDGWHLVVVPRAGCLVLYLAAYLRYLRGVLAASWVQGERIKLSAEFIFYRETDRRRCICILCGARIAVQIRKRHLERNHGRELT